MSNVRQIVIGETPDKPVLVLRPSSDLAGIKRGKTQEIDGPVGRAIAALQGLPEVLFKGYTGTTKLMEVQINGDLVRASDGVGYRAFAVGDGGIVESAKLLDPSHLPTLINVAAVWRLASIVVGQKYLADIQETLKKIEGCVSGIAAFQRDEQTSKIEFACDYLRQVQRSLSMGEREAAVRNQLESIEREMGAIQGHLKRRFYARLKSKIQSNELFGYRELLVALVDKMTDLHRLLSEHRLAGLARLGALQMLSMFPGGSGLQGARAEAVQEGAKQNRMMCDECASAMSAEVEAWTGRGEEFLTIAKESILPLPIKWFWSQRRPTGSATPKLDEAKRFADASIREAAIAEVKAAENFMSAVDSLNLQATRLEESKRYLVEWGEARPLRIGELAVSRGSRR